ncbi:MAG TPA: type I DNA topoisomerase [Candidatus Saccharimonadales bacterium]|nr:type I DNA topoisomerase [Candidatus Saccharimonadales bacterium]
MSKNLVIVESPAKAKTISGFLGKDYEVKSSYGHIMDLPKKGLGVEVDKRFKPTYEVSPDKQKIAAELKKAAKNKIVWLASDEDREGEAIAWHIAYILGLDSKKANRIVFHEITRPAIEAAIEKPRQIDVKLVDSQQARRILDRLVGYELSPVLWKKVRTGLSAGRVQSVAVRLIVEREREIKEHIAESDFEVSGIFDAAGKTLEAKLSTRLKDEKKARQFLNDIKPAKFSVKRLEQKPGKRSPSPPFITSTLQQEAARRLGFSVRQTMTLAQRLYENGHITYMRTDSLNLSPIAVTAAESYIKKNFGEKYSNPTRYKTKDASAQEAHEAIRPTSFSKLSAGVDASQKKLYELIWRRALASQMAPAAIERTEVDIDISSRPELFLAVGEVLLFDGFLKVYGGGKEDQILPALQQGDKLKLKSAAATESYSRAPARYSEASLVRKLEELGIGRPSTYAPTIGTIQDRGYIEKGDVEGELKPARQLSLRAGKITEESQEIRVGADRGKLLPTYLADVVTDFLLKHFEPIMDYDFTAKAEEEFDDIADGKTGWQDALEHFYRQFHPLVKKSEKADRAEAAQARQLGKDPKTGKIVVVRYGRYGPVLQLGEAGEDAPEDAKPVFAPLPEGATLEDITLKEALPMFRLPRAVGQTKEGAEITANIGRFGPYVHADKLFVSIKGQDPLTITETEARKLIEEKKEKERKKVIADFGKIRVLNGPYGPYVTDGKINARVPKGIKPDKLDEKASRKLLEDAPKKPSRRFTQRAVKSS